MPDINPPRPSRKGKEREQARDPVPTDLAEKFIAHQRRTAAYVLSTFSRRLICMCPTSPSPVADAFIQFPARPSLGIDPSAPSPPSSSPHLQGGHTRHPHRPLYPLTTFKRQTQTSSLVYSRYPLLPTRVPDPIISSTIQTPIPFRCAILTTPSSWSNVVHPISLRVPRFYLARNRIPLSARMRSSVSCSIIARMIPFVSRT